MTDEINEKLRRMTEEQRELERRYMEIEQHNSDLTNLWVASNRLHESLDRGQVLRAIQEIVINLVGSEELAVFEVTEDGTALELVDSFGVEAKNYARIPLGSGRIGKVAADGQPLLTDGAPDQGITACIPLMLGTSAVGAVALFRLLPQKKDELQPIDRELLELLRAQAGLALYCTRLLPKRRDQG